MGAWMPIVAQRLADHRAYGQVGYVVIVHHIEMHPVGAGGEYRPSDVITQAGESPQTVSKGQ